MLDFADLITEVLKMSRKSPNKIVYIVANRRGWAIDTDPDNLDEPPNFCFDPNLLDKKILSLHDSPKLSAIEHA